MGLRECQLRGGVVVVALTTDADDVIDDARLAFDMEVVVDDLSPSDVATLLQAGSRALCGSQPALTEQAAHSLARKCHAFGITDVVAVVRAAAAELAAGDGDSSVGAGVGTAANDALLRSGAVSHAGAGAGSGAGVGAVAAVGAGAGPSSSSYRSSTVHHGC